MSRFWNTIIPVFIIIQISVAGWYLYTNGYLSFFERRVVLSGQIIDAETSYPVEGVNLISSDLNVVSDENGFFILDSVSYSEDIVVSSQNYSRDVVLNVSDIDENTHLLLSEKLIRTYTQIEDSEKDKNYNYLYDLLSAEAKSSIEKEEFMIKKEEWYQNLISSKGYDPNSLFVRVVLTSVEQKAQNSLEVDVNYILNLIDGTQDRYVFKIPLVFENDAWLINDANILLTSI